MLSSSRSASALVMRWWTTALAAWSSSSPHTQSKQGHWVCEWDCGHCLLLSSCISPLLTCCMPCHALCFPLDFFTFCCWWLLRASVTAAVLLRWKRCWRQTSLCSCAALALATCCILCTRSAIATCFLPCYSMCLCMLCASRADRVSLLDHCVSLFFSLSLSGWRRLLAGHVCLCDDHSEGARLFHCLRVIVACCQMFPCTALP